MNLYIEGRQKTWNINNVCIGIYFEGNGVIDISYHMFVEKNTEILLIWAGKRET